jgi:O-antigen/teichoic acid export membrane protein
LAETPITFNVPRGTAYITIQQIVIYATSLVYYVLLIRVLSLPQVGEISLLTAALVFFTTISQLSLPAAATRFISSSIGAQNFSQAAGIARISLRLLIATGPTSLFLAVLASPLIGTTIFNTSNPTPLIVTFAGSFLIDLTTLFGAYFLGLGRYAELAYQNFLYYPLSRGLGLVLASTSLGILGIPAGWALGAFATLVLSVYLWKGKLPQAASFPARTLLVFSLPLFASTVVTLLQSWGDIALLQAILGQFGTTGAYYLVVGSTSFLSILWTPVAGALYPALSSHYAKEGPSAVSPRLAVASRLVNLTVLPTCVGLAAVARTVLEAVYGASLASQTVTLAIVSATLIFSAQGFLLTTVLQAVNKTAHVLGISLAATIIDLVTVGLSASALGTTAGAIGRALLAVSMMLLAWLSLRPIIDVPVFHGLSKSLALTIVTALPLVIVDTILTLSLGLAPLLRIPALFGIFAICFLAGSRGLNVFADEDFELLKNALPRSMSWHLRMLRRLLVRRSSGESIEVLNRRV